MSAADELKFEKEVDQIEAELGDDYLVRLLQCLTSSSPEANRGLLELHSELFLIVFEKSQIRPHHAIIESRQISHELC
ncbi:hypothetical protein RB195_020160 [Necator americanus]|uniref:Uncharacterized protein n=1 Tax=Necator americanus TaxID=51031 RepID=A0ABR1CL29_NECAM